MLIQLLTRIEGLEVDSVYKDVRSEVLEKKIQSLVGVQVDKKGVRMGGRRECGEVGNG